ncbi:MAG TPA: phosphoglycerate dehydrogenase [Rhodothermales bacterium]|nr:phosphoglycerate dehydrogenase [Rhodothermales bacterium]
MAYSVLITDSVDPVCIDMLKQKGVEANVQLKKSPEELKELAKTADGWIIRSGTTITGDLIEAATKLKVIGRAGVGVDNVDLETATRKGVLVINAPDGNTISTAEHTCAMLMALARHIPQASASLASGKWEKKKFTGSELNEKTLGIVGLGKIGRTVAERMKGFGMQILGYDPLVSPDVAERLGVKLVSLDELFAESDFITFHTPLNDATRGLLNRETLKKCKKGVRVINCARGGIIDEQALAEGLESGQVGGAALDVYSKEPPPPELENLLKQPNLVATPHIAASTEEAQEKVAIQITDQVIKALNGEPVNSPVNGMAIKMAAQPEVQPYLQLVEKLGQIVGQLGDQNLVKITVRCVGDVPRRYTEVLSIAAVMGVIARWRSEPVNLINAPYLAEEMGLQIEEQRDTSKGHYTNLVEVTVEGKRGSHEVAGTVFENGDLRLVRVDGFWLEVRPEGHLLMYRNVDRPGMLSAVGSVLAENNINIGALALGRTGKGSMALTAISVDEDIPDAVLDQIEGVEGVESVKVVNL